MNSRDFLLRHSGVHVPSCPEISHLNNWHGLNSAFKASSLPTPSTCAHVIYTEHTLWNFLAMSCHMPPCLSHCSEIVILSNPSPRTQYPLSQATSHHTLYHSDSNTIHIALVLFHQSPFHLLNMRLSQGDIVQKEVGAGL